MARSRNLKVKSNFKTQFKNNLECSVENCSEIEDQPHLFKCKPVLNKLNKKYKINEISYKHIFANHKKQKKVVQILVALLEIRNALLQNTD